MSKEIEALELKLTESRKVSDLPAHIKLCEEMEKLKGNNNE